MSKLSKNYVTVIISIFIKCSVLFAASNSIANDVMLFPIVVKDYTALKNYYGPRYTATGTYTFEPASGKFKGNFTFSNFRINIDGPSAYDQFEMQIDSITSKELIFRDEEGKIYNWKRISRGIGLPGVWKMEVSDGIFQELSLNNEGLMSFTMYGSMNVGYPIKVRKHTITIDGTFTDWSTINPIVLDRKNSDCNNAPGTELRKLYIAQDDDFIYVAMALNGPPAPGFRYKFGQAIHLRVTAEGGIGLASPICGKFYASAQLAFGSIPNYEDHMFEARFPKCVAHGFAWWHPDHFQVWSDQDSDSYCRHLVELPTLIFDYSSCTSR